MNDSMATIVPRRLGAKLMFFKTRVGPFAENAAAIGLSPDDAAELAARVAAAEAAHLAQITARQEAATATSVYNQSIDALAGFGATLILKVRSKAESSGDPGVYPLAALPFPSGKSPLAAPGTPTNFRSAVDAIGQVTLRWDCPNPKGSTGTIYQVRRRLGGGTSGAGGPFVPIGIAGQKRFVDTTIPAGATSIVYEVQAVRSTAVGKAATFNVSFGSNGVTMVGEYRSTAKPRQFAA